MPSGVSRVQEPQHYWEARSVRASFYVSSLEYPVLRVRVAWFAQRSQAQRMTCRNNQNHWTCAFDHSTTDRCPSKMSGAGSRLIDVNNAVTHSAQLGRFLRDRCAFLTTCVSWNCFRLRMRVFRPRRFGFGCCSCGTRLAAEFVGSEFRLLVAILNSCA